MSLRNRLITRISLALALSGILTAALGGLGMRKEVNQLLDQELGQIARISSQIVAPSSDTPTISASEWRQGSREGVVIVQRWSNGERISLVPTRVQLPMPTEAGYRNIRIRGNSWRSYALKTSDGWVVAAQPNEARHELITGAYWMAVAPVLLGTPLAAILVFVVIGRALAPLRRLVAELRERPALATAPLNTADVPEEVNPLVQAFNELLHRVSASVERERSFVTDAAHALRTPVTALLLQAQSLQEARAPSDARERLEDLVAGIGRARRTVEQLLELARSEGRREGRVSVYEALRGMPGELQALLDAKRITLSTLVADTDDAIVPMHPAALHLAIHSVLENAVKYSPPDSTITIGSFRSGDHCRVRIVDEGPGLPAAELERVFDRFYRPANDTTSGTGLGLSIVRAIVESARGRVWLEPRNDRSGLSVVMELPLA